MRYLLNFAMLLFLSACGNEMEDIIIGQDADIDSEVITLGPYIKQCEGFYIGSDVPVQFDCYVEFNTEADRWQFFCEPIHGFDFEPGYIYTLELRLEDRGEEIQDVSRYTYHLVRIIRKIKASDDFDSGLSC